MQRIGGVNALSRRINLLPGIQQELGVPLYFTRNWTHETLTLKSIRHYTAQTRLKIDG